MSTGMGVFSRDNVKRELFSMNVDSSNPDPKYWEEVLAQCGLSMNRGKFLKSAGEFITAGGTAGLDAIDIQQQQKATGRVKPSGHGPDD